MLKSTFNLSRHSRKGISQNHYINTQMIHIHNDFNPLCKSIYQYYENINYILNQRNFSISTKAFNLINEKTEITNRKVEKIEIKEKIENIQKDSEKTGERISLQYKKSDTGKWFENVVTAASLIDYYSISGFYILKPDAYAIWENIQQYFDKLIKEDGVKNCYFPILVPKSILEKEAAHVEGFAPEVAWVTHSGDKELNEKLAIRPTSETVMYPIMKNWVRSYKDFPVRINQWANVVRWEMKNPVPFLRSREFLWQEGHTMFATKEEAHAEVFKILSFYQKVYEDLLAIPVIPGKKSESEKFAGADFTTTIEAFVDINGRSIQGATSHHLGRNFSKMFDITFTDEHNEAQFAYQNSWGLSTRTIGSMILIHGDDYGMILPPRIAPTQVVIIPILKSGDNAMNENIMKEGEALERKLKNIGIRASFDQRLDKSVRHKKGISEIKGIPIVIELGARDFEKQSCIVCRRDKMVDGRMEKGNVKLNQLEEYIKILLEEIHSNLYKTALSNRKIKYTIDWNEMIEIIGEKKQALVPFCGSVSCEHEIQELSGQEFIERKKNSEDDYLTGKAKSLCIPFESHISYAENQQIYRKDVEQHKCIGKNCKHNAKVWALFGRSY